jgi:hypothetical protein
MSTTTKSPKKVASAALDIAIKTLPLYARRFSPKKFTLPQLFTCLVLKKFFKTDYRGITAIPADSPAMASIIGLKTIPHYTTIQKSAQRLLNYSSANNLLWATIDYALQNRRTIKVTALDATGLESGHISPYFYKTRLNGQKNRKWTHFTRWPKIAVVADVDNHLIDSVYPTRGPGRDSTHFKEILNALPPNLRIKHIVADAGYDAEDNHVYAREVLGIKTTIPPKVGRAPKKYPGKPYRRMMRLHFAAKTYCKRWQVETVFSMIKRNLGYCLYGKTQQSQNCEMFLLAITHNIIIILFLFFKELFYKATITKLMQVIEKYSIVIC